MGHADYLLNLHCFYKRMILTELYPLLILGLAFLGYLVFALRYYSAFTLPKEHPADENSQQGLSVIIAARNELDNLEKHLPFWLSQRKENFEVVVVNDRSWDGTEEYLSELVKSEPKLSVSTITENDSYKFGKKFALTVGIKKAKYNNLFFTDADAYPNDNTLLKEIAKDFDSGNTLIIGYSPVLEAEGFLGFIQRCEHFFTAVSYYGFGKRQQPYMGVGRFLGYTRELYDAVRGFKSHYHVPFGDDDLFVQSTESKAKLRLVHPDRRVNTYAKKTWGAWFKQRKRHFAASKQYKSKFKFLLSLPSLFNTLFYAGIVLAFVLKADLIISLSLISARLLVGMVIGLLNGRFFGSPLLGIFMPFWEIIIFIIHPFIYLSTILKPTKHW